MKSSLVIIIGGAALAALTGLAAIVDDGDSGADNVMAEVARMNTDDLVGKWKLEQAEGCNFTFPSELEFQDLGLYAAPTGPDEGAIWHGGEWELVANGRLAVMASNDAMLRYEIVLLTRDRLTLAGEDGCTVRFSRISG